MSAVLQTTVLQEWFLVAAPMSLWQFDRVEVVVAEAEVASGAPTWSKVLAAVRPVHDSAWSMARRFTQDNIFFHPMYCIGLLDTPIFACWKFQPGTSSQ